MSCIEREHANRADKRKMTQKVGITVQRHVGTRLEINEIPPARAMHNLKTIAVVYRIKLVLQTNVERFGGWR
jgi:hypothetical protein